MQPEDREEVKQIVYKALGEHREDVEERLNTMHLDMVSIRNEMTGLRGDFSRFTASVTETTKRMSNALEEIATNMGKLSDLPETWAKLKGFWAVMTWARTNWFLILFLLGCMAGAVYATLAAVGIRIPIGA